MPIRYTTFESAVFKVMCEVYGIRKTKTTPLHPQSEIMTELEYLRKVVSEQQNYWVEHIPRFLLTCRSGVHDSTSRSSAKLILRTEIKLPCDLEFGVKPATERDATYTRKEKRLNELHEFVRTHIKMVNDKIKPRFQTSFCFITL